MGIYFKGWDLFGVDMKATYADDENNPINYSTQMIDKNEWWLNQMLKPEKIELKAPFQTKRNMLRYG